MTADAIYYWHSILGSKNPRKDAWKDTCERCTEPTEFEKTKLCGGCITASLCRVCMREWETHPKMRELTHMLHASNIQINAAIKAGSSEVAKWAHKDAVENEEDLFAFTLAWLAERPERPVGPVVQGDVSPAQFQEMLDNMKAP